MKRILRSRWFQAVVVGSLGLVVGGVWFVVSARARSVRQELTEPKTGWQYELALFGLSLRDPAVDARRDLAEGDNAVYSLGLGREWPGGNRNLERWLSLVPLHQRGCLGSPGGRSIRYSPEGARYVAAYNAAKIAALPETVEIAGGPETERQVLDLLRAATERPGETVVQTEARR